MQNILITGGRNPTSLELARLLGTINKIWLADSVYFSFPKYSRYIHQFIHTPSPRFETDDYIQLLLKVIRDNQITMLIPDYEEAFYITQARPLFEQADCRIFCDDFENLCRVHHKWEFHQMTQNLSLQTPPAEFIENTNDLESLGNESREYIFKPVFSRFSAKLLIRPGKEKLLHTIQDKHCPYIAQKFIAGKELCTYSIINHGKVVAHASYEHPYTMGKGSGIFFTKINKPILEKFVKEFAETYNYHGQIGFDYIEDNSGKIYVIEANPRTISGIHLFSQDDQLGKTFINNIDKNEGIIYPHRSNPRMNLLTFVTYNLAKSLRQKKLFLFLKDISSARDVIFNINDPLPFFMQTFTLGEFFWQSLKYRINLAEAFYYDASWGGE